MQGGGKRGGILYCTYICSGERGGESRRGRLASSGCEAALSYVVCEGDNATATREVCVEASDARTGSANTRIKTWEGGRLPAAPRAETA